MSCRLGVQVTMGSTGKLEEIDLSPAFKLVCGCFCAPPPSGWLHHPPAAQLETCCGPNILKSSHPLDLLPSQSLGCVLSTSSIALLQSPLLNLHGQHSVSLPQSRALCLQALSLPPIYLQRSLCSDFLERKKKYKSICVIL